MSFINRPAISGHTYAPGWFLVNNEDCTRETRTISATGVTADADGGKHVAMGTLYPANDATAIGILYEDVDVTGGDMPGSVVTAGTVYLDRLPVAPAEAAKTALEGLGFKFVTTAPVTTRPADGTET
jgi:hypothetical protein